MKNEPNRLKKVQGKGSGTQPEVWNALAPSSLISVAWEMDTTQASLQRGANLPVLAGVLRYSVCTGCHWQEKPQCL